MDAATQAQIAKVIWHSIDEGRPVTDTQRAQLAQYIMLGMAPVDEGALADELDVAEAVDAERERCAKIVENLARIFGNGYVDPNPKFNTAAAALSMAQTLAEAAAVAIRTPARAK